MPFHRIVGLQIDDPETYQKYRAAMEPILKRYGGAFRYDFWISEVLKNETDKKINRVFMITFPNKQSKESFFNDTEYQEIRKTFFNPSVSDTTVLAEYETN